MTYTRKVKKGNTVQLYEVKSVREGKKVRQEFIRYIGVVKQTEQGEVVIPAHKDLIDRLVLQDDVNLGDVTALYYLAEELKIPEIIDEHSIKGLPAGPQLVLLAINHAIHPVSLRSFSTWYKETALPQLVGIPQEKLNVENLTSAMDGICREIEGTDGDIRVVDKTQDICAGLTKVWSPQYGITLDALYYDITSTYFEGVKCILAKLGYNRDGKKGNGQINIALVVTKKEGFPLFFRVYEGNVLDQKTVKNVLQDLKVLALPDVRLSGIVGWSQRAMYERWIAAVRMLSAV